MATGGIISPTYVLEPANHKCHPHQLSLQIYIYALIFAYFQKMKVGLSNHQSVCFCISVCLSVCQSVSPTNNVCSTW
jgi:hypothetical protein